MCRPARGVVRLRGRGALRAERGLLSLLTHRMPVPPCFYSHLSEIGQLRCTCERKGTIAASADSMLRMRIFNVAACAAAMMRPSAAGTSSRVAVTARSLVRMSAGGATPPVAKRVPHSVKFGKVRPLSA